MLGNLFFPSGDFFRFCEIVVGKDGTVKDAKVVRGIHPEFDAEALRLVENMPKWIPGKLAGETVEVRYTLPVPLKWK